MCEVVLGYGVHRFCHSWRRKYQICRRAVLMRRNDITLLIAIVHVLLLLLVILSSATYGRPLRKIVMHSLSAILVSVGHLAVKHPSPIYSTLALCTIYAYTRRQLYYGSLAVSRRYSFIHSFIYLNQATIGP